MPKHSLSGLRLSLVQRTLHNNAHGQFCPRQRRFEDLRPRDLRPNDPRPEDPRPEGGRSPRGRRPRGESPRGRKPKSRCPSKFCLACAYHWYNGDITATHTFAHENTQPHIYPYIRIARSKAFTRKQIDSPCRDLKTTIYFRRFVIMETHEALSFSASPL